MHKALVIKDMLMARLHLRFFTYPKQMFIFEGSQKGTKALFTLEWLSVCLKVPDLRGYGLMLSLCGLTQM